MSDEKKILEEALAIRYMDLAGLGHINEEIDIEDLDEPVEGAHAGGDNLVHPVDHVAVVSDESNVEGVEVMDVETGEVEVTDIDIKAIAEAVKSQIESENQE